MNLVDGELTLRALESDDAPMLYDLMSDAQVEASVVGWSGPVSLASQETWVESVRPNDFRFAIDWQQRRSGVAQLSPVDLKNRSASLHIKLLPVARGKGVGSRTVALLLKYGFLELGLEIMSATVLEENSASRALFERSGFVTDGVLRSRVYKQGKRQSLVVYSVTKAEYVQWV